MFSSANKSPDEELAPCKQEFPLLIAQYFHTLDLQSIYKSDSDILIQFHVFFCRLISS